jgi:predicted Zn-dependent protease
MKIMSRMTNTKINRDNQSTKTVMDLTKQSVYVRKRKGKESGKLKP